MLYPAPKHQLFSIPYALFIKDDHKKENEALNGYVYSIFIRIMRAFVSMRHFMASNTAIFQRFETLVRCLNFHPDAVKNTSGMSLELHPRCH